MKYRSLAFDLTILFKTFWLLLLLRADFRVQPASMPVLRAPVSTAVDDVSVSHGPVGAMPMPSQAVPATLAAVNDSMSNPVTAGYSSRTDAGIAREV
jgi:hypothetical protein